MALIKIKLVWLVALIANLAIITQILAAPLHLRVYLALEELQILTLALGILLTVLHASKGHLPQAQVILSALCVLKASIKTTHMHTVVTIVQ
jgi:hypothetical protein